MAGGETGPSADAGAWECGPLGTSVAVSYHIVMAATKSAAGVDGLA